MKVVMTCGFHFAPPMTKKSKKLLFYRLKKSDGYSFNDIVGVLYCNCVIGMNLDNLMWSLKDRFELVF